MRSYFTEDAKVLVSNAPKWDIDECRLIQDILKNKGYDANIVYRLGCDRKFHQAIQINREDAPRLMEQCFRQRLVFEAQAEGKGKVTFNFAYDYYADTIIDAFNRFWKNKKN